jgi:lysosomal Pro-X carboxypeptidase
MKFKRDRKTFFISVVGSIAASAPIWQFQADCDAFLSVNTNAFAKADQHCPSLIRQSWTVINQLGETADGLKTLTSLFGLCEPLKSVKSLKDWLIDIYGNVAMANYPYETNFLAPLPANPVKVCNKMLTT